MGSLKTTLCTGAVAVAAALLPTAYASGADDRGVVLTPALPAPGAEVVLTVSGCAVRTATAASAAFVADARLVGTGGTLVGETRVRSSAEAGGYDVRVTCAGREVRGRVEVAEPGAGTGAGVGPGAVRPSRSAGSYEPPGTQATPATPATPASPVAPVRAGGGGSSALAAQEPADGPARAEGPGTAQAVTGLLLAGAAGAVVVHRGLRRRRGTG